MTKRELTKSKVFKFTAKCKVELDKNLYPNMFGSFRRVGSYDRFKKNDMVAVVGRGDIKVMEKFVHRKDIQSLYYEVKHTNQNGKLVNSSAMRSIADIIVYVIYDDDVNQIDQVYVFSMRKLRKLAVDTYKTFKKEGKSYSIKEYVGDKLKTGERYTVYSYEFNPETIDEDIFVKVEGEKVQWIGIDQLIKEIEEVKEEIKQVKKESLEAVVKELLGRFKSL